MNNLREPIAPAVATQSAEAFAHYLENTASRIDVKTVRLAFGGMAATVKRGAKAEAALLGKAWNEDSVNAAKAALAEDFKPMSDMRASADYRLQVAQNLIQRLWLETRAQQPVSIAETSVWSVMPHVVV